MKASEFLKEHRCDVVIVLILLILGLVTRFLGISYQSLWIDEGATYYYSHFTWEQYSDAAEPNSPVFYMMEGAFFSLLGRNEFAMRFFSALCSAFTVPLVYVLSQKIVGNKYVSAVAGALTLISPMMIEYGQEGRGYAAIVFLFMCQMLALIYALERREWKFWIALSVFSALGMCMHYVSIVASFTIYLYAVLYLRREWLRKEFGGLIRTVASGMLALILSSPLIAYMIDAGKESSSHEHWDWCYVGPDYLYDLLRDFLFDIDFLILVPIVALGGFLLLRMDRTRGSMVCWFTLVPLILSTAASYMMNMTPRYVLWGAIGMYIMLACSVLLLTDGDDRKLRRNAAVAAVAIIIIACVCLPTYYTEVTKTDYRGGAQALEDNVQEGDTVLYAPSWENMVFGALSFYYDPTDHGAYVYGVSSDEEFQQYLSEATGTVYVVVMQEYPPFDLLEDTDSPNCQKIHTGYWMTVWKITGPL